MLRNQRQREILNILNIKDGFVSVKDLCAELFASESSIRRDLSHLENEGAIKRTHGGAELIRNLSNVVTFTHRTQHNINAKKLIAQKAAKKVFLCDSEKLGTKSAYIQCHLSDIDYIVCKNEKAQGFRKYSESLTIL